MRELTDERAGRYGKDPILFLEDQYVLPETMRAIILEPWQKDWILKPLLYDLQENGRRKYNVALIGLPKKNGKSAMGAGLGVWQLFAGEPYSEIIVAANSRDQASMIIYTKMRRSVNLNPNLRRGAAPLKEVIEIKSTGSTARCLAHQYESAAGLNPSLTIFDELWAFTDRRFYDELTVVPTRPDPLVLIVTYAGYEQGGLLWDLYCDGLEGDTILDTGDPEIIVKRGKNDTRMFMFWSHKNLASWITPQYLESQQRRLPPDVYARLHENRWVAASSQFITTDDINALHGEPWVMQFGPDADRPFHYIVATDVGLSHDRTARVVGHFNPANEKVYVDNIRIWEGTQEEHVDLKEVEADLVDCANRYRARTLIVDPWQMEYTIQRLQGIYNVVPFNPTADMMHLSQVFVNMLRSRRVICYTDLAFEQELKDAVVKQTQQGWRIDHYGKRRNDIVVAMGMMMLEAVKGHYGSLIMPGDNEFVSNPLGFRNIRERKF